MTWQWQLQGTINDTYNVQIYDIDLLNTSTSEIQQLQVQNRKVICYFSAGSYEAFRADAASFPLAVLGANLDGFPDEKWLDIRSQAVLDIMKARLDVAVSKGCDGVEPDTTVVEVEGLVGRVVGVAPWTSDVLLVGAPELSVGVRVGTRGVLGEASGSAAAGATAPDPGRLSVALVERGRMSRGDDVLTLGSVGERPFVAGVRVGRVESVQRSAGRLADTGTLVPAVDTTSLDVVAVVLPPVRDTPRPALTPTAADR